MPRYTLINILPQSHTQFDLFRAYSMSNHRDGNKNSVVWTKKQLILLLTQIFQFLWQTIALYFTFAAKPSNTCSICCMFPAQPALLQNFIDSRHWRLMILACRWWLSITEMAYLKHILSICCLFAACSIYWMQKLIVLFVKQ